MKSIDLLFTSDSFEHNACDVSVANLQSQYTFLYITLTCKEKEKREKEIPVIPDWELRSTVGFVSERSCWMLCLLPHGSDAVDREGWMGWGFGSDGERLEPERGSLWQWGTKAGVRKMRSSQGHDPMSFTHVHMRVISHVCESARQDKHTKSLLNTYREKNRQFQISSFKPSDCGKSMESRRTDRRV